LILREESIPNAPIPNGVVAKRGARVMKQENIGEAATYYEGRTLETNHLSVGTWRVEPGKSPHGAHTHPEEELLVFTEGTGEVSIQDKRYKVAPGSVMYCAGNLLHGVYNTGPDNMLFYFVKWKV
jgi:quercetin dioxygenase-like cupin family protein